MGKKKKEKKRNSLYSLRDFGSFRDAVFITRASNEELSKIHLAFERERRHEVSVSIRLERHVISGVRPTDQHRSAGTTFSGSDDWLLQLTRSYMYSATCTRSSQLQRWDAAKRRFSFRFQKALPVYSTVGCRRTGVDGPSLVRSYFSRLQPISLLFFDPSTSHTANLVALARYSISMLHKHATHAGPGERFDP